MYSDAAKTVKIETDDDGANGHSAPFKTRSKHQTNVPVYEKWKDWQASEISHHRKICCEIAREWLTATDFSELAANGGIFTGPRWLRQRFKWGASSFPIYWCEAVRKKTLDCGAHAALAHEAFKTRGVPSYRVQMVQKFSETATQQWKQSWNSDDAPLRWTQNDLIYHEGCAIATAFNDEIKIWDASAGWWIEPTVKDGYGALLAVRLSLFNLPDAKFFTWGNHSIKAFEWTLIK